MLAISVDRLLACLLVHVFCRWVVCCVAFRVHRSLPFGSVPLPAPPFAKSKLSFVCLQYIACHVHCTQPAARDHDFSLFSVTLRYLPFLLVRFLLPLVLSERINFHIINSSRPTTTKTETAQRDNFRNLECQKAKDILNLRIATIRYHHTVARRIKSLKHFWTNLLCRCIQKTNLFTH